MIEKLKDQFAVWNKLPEPKFIVENLIMENSINMIVAPSNAGKTIIATELLLNFGSGGNFFNRKVEKTNAFYIDLELQKDMYFLRLKKYALPLTDNLFYSEERTDILKEDQFENFIKEIKENNISVVIIDSYSQLMVGYEENSNTIQATILSKLTRLKKEKITTIFLHHTRKGSINSDNAQDSVRGGSVIFSGCDTVLLLQKNSALYHLKQIKSRLDAVENWLDEYFSISNAKGYLEFINKNEEKINNSLASEIILYLENNKDASGNNIAISIGKNRKNVSDELKKLVDSGIISQYPKEPKKGQKITYNLIDKNNTEQEINIDELV